jgi:hypothetical protein
LIEKEFSMSKKDKIIYRLTVEDIQTVATETFGRELSADEIEKLIEPIGESIAWFDIIENCIRGHLGLEYAEE